MIRPLLLVMVLVTGSSSAFAHKMRLFATAKGATISGRAYFSAEAPAMGIEVEALTPDGATAFTGRTNDDGRFSFDAAVRVDHLLIADGGDGHQARFTVHADELHPTLPRGDVAAIAPLSPAPSATATAGLSDEALRAIDAAVARHVAPLREELAAHDAAVGWRDAVGGLGYIIGLGGLAYGLSARYSKGRSQA